jgi:hypothetical protein
MKINGHNVNDITDQGFYSYMSKANPNIRPGTAEWVTKRTDFEQGVRCLMYFLQATILQGQREGRVAGDISAAVSMDLGLAPVLPKDLKK